MAKNKAFEFDDVNDELTDRQKLFCMLYVGECKFNGTESAKKAGYSNDTATEQASRLLANVKVSEYISLLKKDLGLRIGVTAEMIAKEYADIAFSKIDDFIDTGNKAKDVTEIIKTNVVHSIKTASTIFDGGERVETEIKLHDKLKALGSLSKMIGCDGVTKVEANLTSNDTIFKIKNNDDK